MRQSAIPSNNSQKQDSLPQNQPVSANVQKRLSQELMTLMMTASPGISAFPKDDGNLFDWAATIVGPVGTVYEGLTFRLRIQFPSSYPYVPPKINFTQPCYHPNVDLSSGAICLDILQDKWSAVYSVQTILLSIQSLFGEPNNNSPLNVDAAGIWDKAEEFKSQLLKHYQPDSAF